MQSRLLRWSPTPLSPVSVSIISLCRDARWGNSPITPFSTSLTLRWFLLVIGTGFIFHSLTKNLKDTQKTINALFSSPNYVKAKWRSGKYYVNDYKLETRTGVVYWMDKTDGLPFQCLTFGCQFKLKYLYCTNKI